MPESAATDDDRAAVREGGRRLLWHLGVLTGGEILARALTFIAFAHLARTLAPATYGLVEAVLAVVLFLNVAVDQGLSVLGAREVAGGNSHLGALIRQVVSIQLPVAVALCALAGLATLVLSLPSPVAELLRGYALTLLPIPFIWTWVLQGSSRMGPAAAVQTLRYAVFAILTLALVTSPDRVTRLPLAEMGGILAAAAAAVALVLRRFGGATGATAPPPALLRESIPVTMSQSIWVLRMYLPTVLLATTGGAAAAGAFGTGHRIVMVLQTLLGVYFTALFPTISRAAFQSVERLTALLRASVPVALWPSVALAGVVTALAAGIVTVVFGPAYVGHGAGGSLAILVWTVPVIAFRRHARSALMALGHQREELWCSIAGLGLQVLLTPPLAFLAGAPGTAVALLVSEVAGAALTWRRLHRHLPALSVAAAVLVAPSWKRLAAQRHSNSRR
ncbi:oligosaccharide flippase family protein [Candidatus Binatia bacterium]|nr:oligosaccharide flippase family protein [Candidatus Binatia bacterium]